jgi:hypothetical protein
MSAEIYLSQRTPLNTSPGVVGDDPVELAGQGKPPPDGGSSSPINASLIRATSGPLCDRFVDDSRYKRRRLKPNESTSSTP